MRERQRVTVEVPGQDPPLRYLGRIEGLLRDQVLISSPLYGGEALPIPVGTPLLVTLYENGGPMAFESQVLHRGDGAVPVLSVTRPAALAPVQRRRFFREPAVLPVKCRSAASRTPTMGGLTRNLSGGGALIRTLELRALAELLEQLAPGEPFELAVGLPDSPLEIRGALRWWRLDDADQQADLAFEFLDLDETERQRLIRFLFVHQREALRKVV
ncbi:MAG: PilZ domain-containing protein [Rubrivivax sp.]|nr:PilZ domain-containing protein [Rubrivivax sp.]